MITSKYIVCEGFADGKGKVEYSTGLKQTVLAIDHLSAAKQFWKNDSSFDFEDTILTVKGANGDSKACHFYPVREEW